ARMQGAGRALLAGKPIYTQEEVLGKIDAVNEESVSDMIDRVLDTDTACFAAVGQAENVEKLFNF
ncbi:MAG: hypothetical protein IJG16_07980, partial [Clostridia bacterium]|nr:hypothetical protein [Clostridia bacterium]